MKVAADLLPAFINFVVEEQRILGVRIRPNTMLTGRIVEI